MDKAALVTGGSSGIGFAIASMLRENGFALTLAAGRSAKVDAAAETLGAHAVVADVAKEEDCRRLVDEHRERHGRLDVLVNSAGVGIAGPVDELETKHIDLQLNVNLRGTILVTAAALPLLREARGLIVNIASIAGTGPAGRLSVYGATKAAVINFTSSLERHRGGARSPSNRSQPRLRRHADDLVGAGPAGAHDPSGGLRGSRACAPPPQSLRASSSRRDRTRGFGRARRLELAGVRLSV